MATSAIVMLVLTLAIFVGGIGICSYLAMKKK
jgi:hypothetical protein